MTVNALTSRLLLAWLLFLKDCDLFELTSLSSVFWSDFLYLPRSLYCPFAQNISCVVFWALLSQLLLEGDPLPHKSLPTLYKCEKTASCVTHWSLGHTVFIENLFNVSGMCYWSCFSCLHWVQELRLSCWVSGLELTQGLACEAGGIWWSSLVLVNHKSSFSIWQWSVGLNLTIKYVQILAWEERKSGIH